jgi:hypothetical protein
MRSGERHGSILYHVAFILLVSAVAVAIGLFARAVRQTSVQAEITVADAEPVDCPTGERAPACFRFEVRNLGPEAAQIGCRLQTTDGALAEFLTGGGQYEYAPQLPPGLAFSIVAKVQPGIDGTVHAPTVACSPS